MEVLGSPGAHGVSGLKVIPTACQEEAEMTC